MKTPKVEKIERPQTPTKEKKKVCFNKSISKNENKNPGKEK